jgi:hypothetical protein
MLAVNLNPRRHFGAQLGDGDKLIIDAGNRASFTMHLSDNDLLLSVCAQQKVHAEL